MSVLVAKASVSGTPAFARRAGSLVHVSGRYSRHWIGRLPASLASDRLPAPWQF
jgi:hypothetical protein